MKKIAKSNNKEVAILQHFAQDERSFVKKALSLKHMIYANQQVKISSFLTQKEQKIYEMIFEPDVYVVFDGGYADAERKLAYISPFEPQTLTCLHKFYVCLEIKYNTKYASLRHSDVLGALLAAGIQKKFIGDIVVFPQRIVVFVSKQIAAFLLQNIQRIGNTGVVLEQLDHFEDEKPQPLYRREVFVVPSLRIDLLLAQIRRCSRKEAQAYIDKQFVQLNWSSISDYQVKYQSGDVLSVRKVGRIYIDTIEKTQKEKYKVNVRMTE